MASGAMRSRRTTSFSWHGDSTDVESSADDFSDNEGGRKWRGRDGYEGESRRTFRSSASFTGKVSYDSDSCLTPRSRRTLRRTLSEVPETKSSSSPALDTIFSPTHEILHPLQSLRLQEQSRKSESPIRGYRTSVTFETFRSTPSPAKFDSYEFPRNSVEYESYTFLKPTVEEEDLEQKQSLIANTVSVKETDSPAPNIIVVILDAEKKLTFVALDWAIVLLLNRTMRSFFSVCLDTSPAQVRNLHHCLAVSLLFMF